MEAPRQTWECGVFPTAWTTPMVPQRSSRSVPAVDAIRVEPPPRDPEAVYLDLITQSLRDACDAQGDRVFPLIAQMIDHHIAGSLQVPRIGRWRNEALDCLLALISPRMPGQVRHLLDETSLTHAAPND